MIIPSTVPGGEPGGRWNKNTKSAKPIPATVPSPIPPMRAPIKMHARNRINSTQNIYQPIQINGVEMFIIGSVGLNHD
jgi:hypothetical protein